MPSNHLFMRAISYLIVGLVFLGSSAVFGQTATPKASKPKVNASGGPLIPEMACYDVQRYVLKIEIQPQERRIEGRLTMFAKATEKTQRIAMDLDAALTISSVSLGKENVAFKREGHRFFVPLAKETAVGDDIVVSVTYGGRPRIAPSPPWQGGFTWTRTKKRKHWIVTSCQGEGADLWWPCKDHPSDEPQEMDLFVTVPKGLTVASNGVLKGVTPQGSDKNTHHWAIRNPINLYCVTLAIAPYVLIKDSMKSSSGRSLPIHFYVLPDQEKNGRKFVAEIKRHLAFMETVAGPYPFQDEKYGVAETPHLGMEHQTLIAYGNDFRGLRLGYDWLHLHELAHEWWGNLVTNRDWKDMWIHEGFATYMEPLYLERLRGPEAYKKEMAKKRRLTNRTPLAPRTSTTSRGIYFAGGGNDIYYKGAWLLHALRYEIGDKAFFAALRRIAYPDPKSEGKPGKETCRFVDTKEIRGLFEQAAQRSLVDFFEVYARTAELPELVHKRDEKGLHLAWKTPKDLPLALAVPVVIDGKPRRIAMPKGRAFVALAPKSKIEVDPDQRLLKKLRRRRR